MQRLERIVDVIAKICAHFCGWLVVAMILLIFYEVFMRYVLNRPPAVADEMAALLLVVIAYLGAAYTWRERGHVRITALTSRLPTGVASWLRLVSLILGFVFVLGLCMSGTDFVQDSFQLKMRSASWLRLPLQGPHLVMVIGFALVLLMVLVDIIKVARKIKAGESAEEEST